MRWQRCVAFGFEALFFCKIFARWVYKNTRMRSHATIFCTKDSSSMNHLAKLLQKIMNPIHRLLMPVAHSPYKINESASISLLGKTGACQWFNFTRKGLGQYFAHVKRTFLIRDVLIPNRRLDHPPCTNTSSSGTVPNPAWLFLGNVVSHMANQPFGTYFQRTFQRCENSIWSTFIWKLIASKQGVWNVENVWVTHFVKHFS